MADTQPLVQDSPNRPAQSWCGLVDCGKLLVWRGEGSDRFKWKLFCSLCMIVEFGYYLCIVQHLPILMVIALLSVTKWLIETWGQDTPNWVCPGGPGMFFVVYFMIFPGIIYSDGICTDSPDLYGEHSLLKTKQQSDALGLLLFLFGS